MTDDDLALRRIRKLEEALAADGGKENDSKGTRRLDIALRYERLGRRREAARWFIEAAKYAEFCENFMGALGAARSAVALPPRTWTPSANTGGSGRSTWATAAPTLYELAQGQELRREHRMVERRGESSEEERVGRRRLRRLAKLLAGLLLAALVLPVAAVEGLYLYGLRLAGELPPAPSVRLSERLKRAVWIDAEDGAFAVTPRYPWHTVLWLAKEQVGDAEAALEDFTPGERVCGRAAKLWLGRRHPVGPKKLERTVAEWSLAKWCTRNWTADQVALFLAEQEYFGRHSFGLEEAAQSYFGKAPEQLASHELALVVGLPQSPSRLNPDCHPDLALERRNSMLERFRAVGLLSEAEFAAAAAQPLGHQAAACERP